MKKRKIIGYSKRAFDLLKRMRPQDLHQYVPNYDELTLKEKVDSLLGVLGENVLLPVFQLYYVLMAKETPKRRKLYIMGGLGYFILPTDLIPDIIPSMLGFTDDLVVISFVLKLVKDSLTPELREKAEERYQKLLKIKKKEEEVTEWRTLE